MRSTMRLTMRSAAAHANPAAVGLLLLVAAACAPEPPEALRADGAELPGVRVVPLLEELDGRTWWFASAPDHVPALGLEGTLRLWALPQPGGEGGGPGEACWLRVASPGEARLTVDIGAGMPELEDELLVLQLLEGLSAVDPSVLFGLDRRDLARTARAALDEGASPLWRRIVPLRESGGRILAEPGEHRWGSLDPVGWLPVNAEPQGFEPRVGGSFVAPAEVVLPLGPANTASVWTESVPGGWALLADGLRCQQAPLQGRFSGVAFPDALAGPLHLAALEEVGPSTFRLGGRRDLQHRDGEGLWLGTLDGEGPAAASLRVEPVITRPEAEEGPPLELVLHDQGALQLRRPALSFRLPFANDAPVELQALGRGPWRVDVEVTAEGWLVRGFDTQVLEEPVGILLQPEVRVVRGGALELAEPAAWPTRGPHLLTLFGTEERIDLPVDFRPEGHVVFGQVPEVPDGSYRAWLRAEVGDGSARDVAFAGVEVRLGEPLVLVPDAGLTLVQGAGDEGPTGRMLIQVDGEGQPLGRGAHAVPRRRADGSFVLAGVHPDMRLVDAATGALVFDRGVPSAGYSVE
jgi:hypothetical protein